MMDALFRHYLPNELGKDGYPPQWHRIDVGSHAYASPGERWGPGIKDIVRLDAGNRCIRCGHPYQNGQHGNGEWSPCDTSCKHEGPFRLRLLDTDDWVDVEYLSRNPEGYLYLQNGGDVEARWRILTVHHLDLNKANCQWWNLASLCQRCHLQIQNKVQIARIYPWEHSEWFKPYAAGFYAWVYLAEQLTREEVVARMDELLALERLA